MPRSEINPLRMELKSFIVQYRIVLKAYNNKIERKKVPLSPGKGTGKITSPSGGQILNANQLNNKFEIQKQIKKVLVNSIRLKMKLKEQVTCLKQKIVIDEKVIMDNLKLTPIDGNFGEDLNESENHNEDSIDIDDVIKQTFFRK